MSLIIPQGNNRIRKTADRPELVYMREVREYLQGKGLCAASPWVDKSVKGYRIKLFRGTEQDIPKVRQALDEGDYSDVSVDLRGSRYDPEGRFVSAIVPYIKGAEEEEKGE